MTRTPRASGAPLYAVVAISLLALLVAATTTAYAAGLARNTVGTKQLKKNAVTAKKIKKNAVTTPKIRKGAVTADRLKAGVVPPRTVHVARDLVVGPDELVVLISGGVQFEVACTHTGTDAVKLSISGADVDTIGYSGLEAFETSAGSTTTPVLVPKAASYELNAVPPAALGFALSTFEGVVTATGGSPVLVQASTRVFDATEVPCSVRLTATPIA